MTHGITIASGWQLFLLTDMHMAYLPTAEKIFIRV
jgi:hypothetical protein